MEHMELENTTNDLTRADGVRAELVRLAQVREEAANVSLRIGLRIMEVANMLPLELHATECPCGLCERADREWVKIVKSEIERARYRCGECKSTNVRVQRIAVDDPIGAYVTITCATCGYHGTTAV